MSEQVATAAQLQSLRTEGVISENEIAILEGDILLAKNVITQERRIIGKSADLLKESTQKKILKG
ncbi:MAG: hypothetical protein CBC29_07025 [Methylococcaceae bacterium TMED69]|nr:MAG: hypothetical protein CBC29_07025 [Methylococcaceae bacterium TMED69]|tara:strand:- start:2265 stop:2459 length:195 start_codon:yes stop_codon:yes gene_type:complete